MTSCVPGWITGKTQQARSPALGVGLQLRRQGWTGRYGSPVAGSGWLGPRHVRLHHRRRLRDQIRIRLRVVLLVVGGRDLFGSSTMSWVEAASAEAVVVGIDADDPPAVAELDLDQMGQQAQVSSKLPPAAITSSTSSVTRRSVTSWAWTTMPRMRGIVEAVGAGRLEDAMGAVGPVEAKLHGSEDAGGGRAGSRWCPGHQRHVGLVHELQDVVARELLGGHADQRRRRPGSPTQRAVGVDRPADDPGRGVEDGGGGGHLLDLVCIRSANDCSADAERERPGGTPGARSPSGSPCSPHVSL